MSDLIVDFWGKRKGIVLCLLTVLAFAVRLPTLSAQPLWNDEAFSLAISTGSLSHTLEMIAKDFHPPGYYLLINVWIRIFGDEAGTVRFLSVLFGVGTVPIVAALGGRISGPLTAVAAGMLFAVSPLQVQWSQIARGYSLMIFMVVLSMYLAWRLIETRGHVSGYKSQWHLYLGYSASLASAMLCHNAALFYGAAALLAMTLVVRRHADIRQALRFTIPLHALAFVPLIPWGVNALDQASRIIHMQQETVYTVVETPFIFAESMDIFGVAFLWKLKSAGVAAVLVSTLLGLWALRRKKNQLLFLAVFAVLLPIALLEGWAWIKPVFGRVLLVSRWLQAPVFLLAGTALSADSAFVRKVTALMVALIMATSLLGLRNYYKVERLQWDEAARVSASPEYAQLPHIAIDGSSVWAWDYYLRKQHARGAITLDDNLEFPERFLLSANRADQFERLAPLSDYSASDVFSARDIIVRLMVRNH